MSERKRTVFISYTYADHDLADYLARDLEASGVSVWRGRSIEPGEKWAGAIEESLRNADFFILLISPAALKSKWVSFEAGVALSRDPESPHRRLLSVLARGMNRNSLPAPLRRLNAIDMEGEGIAQASRRVADVVAAAVRADDEDGDNT